MCCGNCQLRRDREDRRQAVGGPSWCLQFKDKVCFVMRPPHSSVPPMCFCPLQAVCVMLLRRISLFPFLLLGSRCPGLFSPSCCKCCRITSPATGSGDITLQPCRYTCAAPARDETQSAACLNPGPKHL